MPRIGVRELKIHVSEVVRDVRETRSRYVVTHRGEPVALIVPYSAREEEEVLTREQAWERFLQSGAKLAQQWKTPLTAVEILDEMRR